MVGDNFAKICKCCKGEKCMYSRLVRSRKVNKYYALMKKIRPKIEKLKAFSV